MSVGAVLLQPERIERARVVDDAPVADVVGLVRLLVDEARAGGPLAVDIEAAFDDLAERMLAIMEGRLAGAGDRLEALVSPVLGAIDVHVGALAAAEDVDDILAALLAVVDDLAGAVAAVDASSVEALVEDLVDILEVDLGLSVGAVRTELLVAADDLVARLEAARPDADEDTRRRALALARMVRRWRDRVSDMEVPALDGQALARQLADLVRLGDMQEFFVRLQCVAAGLRAAVDAGASLTATLGTAGFGPGSLGAAAAPPPTSDTHVWYLTWLLGAKQPWYSELLRTVAPWIPYDEVWVEVDAGKVMRRDVFGDHVEVADGTDWTQSWVLQRDAPQDKLEALGLDAHYTFGRNDDVETLEQVAWVSAIVVHGLEAVLNLASLEEGDYAANAFGAFNTTVLALLDGLDRAPLPWYVDTLTMRTLLPLVTSLEGMHTRTNAKNCFLMWLTLVGPDLGEVVAYRATLVTLRDILLSFLTLRNHEQPTTPGLRKPSNRLESAGFVTPFVSLFSFLNRLIVPKDKYGIENLGSAEVLLPWLLSAPIFGLFGSVIGHIVSEEAVAKAGDYGPLGGHILKTVFKEWVMFVPSWYLGAEGATGKGTYNPDGADFPGYPDADTSPYRLPWTPDQSVYVGQGNQGMFSHFDNNGEVYAYDFSMDQDEDILASRPGTVVSFRDTMTDDSENNDAAGNARWNFIRIRHDQDGGPIAGHDRDETGTVTTYASYGHGRQGSVTAAFATRGVAAGSIVGSTVARGDVIMGAGDTGKSFHNHLHMEVHRDDGTGNPDTSTTLPFVFREVAKRHEVGDFFGLLANPAGVPTKFNSYTSDNR